VIDQVNPDIFVVNTDGNTPDKQALCEARIEYLVLQRTRTRAGPRFVHCAAPA
jgi:hypothetical protein